MELADIRPPDDNMFPCGEHGEKLATLTATMNALERRGDERHAENGRKLDRIIAETTEANHRLRSLEEWRAAQVVRADEVRRVVAAVEEIREEQESVKTALQKRQGEASVTDRLSDRLDRFMAPAISGVIVGLSLLAAKAIWHL